MSPAKKKPSGAKKKPPKKDAAQTALSVVGQGSLKNLRECVPRSNVLVSRRLIDQGIDPNDGEPPKQNLAGSGDVNLIVAQHL
jgi:hypothetical protein